jgi:hypothetical protein
MLILHSDSVIILLLIFCVLSFRLLFLFTLIIVRITLLCLLWIFYFSSIFLCPLTNSCRLTFIFKSVSCMILLLGFPRFPIDLYFIFTLLVKNFLLIYRFLSFVLHLCILLPNFYCGFISYLFLNRLILYLPIINQLSSSSFFLPSNQLTSSILVSLFRVTFLLLFHVIISKILAFL